MAAGNFRKDVEMSMKTAIRDLLPLRYQVPAKYLFNRIGGRMEPELEILGRLIDRGAHVIDVGGNRGTYAYKLHGLGCRVEVFEPNSVCAGILSAWAAGKSNVTVHSVALSNSEGNAVLHVPVDASGTAHDASASLENTPAGAVENKTVALRTLDSYGFHDISFIKIDVEGHESSVIEGASGSIVKMKPALLVEIEQRHIHRPISEVFGSILDFGYQGFYLRNGRIEGISGFDPGKDQDFEGALSAHGNYINNFIFVHPATVNDSFRRMVADAGMSL
jgi:FkbM family methyltransferase